AALLRRARGAGLGAVVGGHDRGGPGLSPRELVGHGAADGGARGRRDRLQPARRGPSRAPGPTPAHMTAPGALGIRDLTVRYGVRLATWAVDLTLAPGEVLGLVGESGAGKSTVGRAVVRLLPDGARLETGSVRLGARDLLRAGAREMRRLRGADIVLVPQDPL